jgi:hypothetical protein
MQLELRMQLVLEQLHRSHSDLGKIVQLVLQLMLEQQVKLLTQQPPVMELEQEQQQHLMKDTLLLEVLDHPLLELLEKMF